MIAHTYEDSVSVNGVATPFCKHCGQLFMAPIHQPINLFRNSEWGREFIRELSFDWWLLGTRNAFTDSDYSYLVAEGAD